jgi:hypothetical protein
MHASIVAMLPFGENDSGCQDIPNLKSISPNAHSMAIHDDEWKKL